MHEWRTAMTKKILGAALMCIMLGISAEIRAEKIYVLYGFKIGQSSDAPVQQFGKPFKSHTFEDGYSYRAYNMKDHMVVFESDNTRPDLIWAIQIQGESNPPCLGLKGMMILPG